MQSLLYAGPIWGSIQQPSWTAQPNAAPVQPPTSMRVMFLVLRLQNLCWILMSELETYVLILLNLCWYFDTCVDIVCVENFWTYVCILMFVLDIYVCDDICDVYMWYMWCIFCLFGWNRKTNLKGVYWSLCRVWHWEHLEGGWIGDPIKLKT